MNESNQDKKPSYYAIIPPFVRYADYLSADAKLLYGELTAYADGMGNCVVNKNEIAIDYRLCVADVDEAINQLEKNVYIIIDSNSENIIKIQLRSDQG